ncbi:hypothetical protein P170DRAFT_507540 [Aspergillus steynii IBT 23096]|uniref:Uncharacterized protein n=1 Tax=Aspergillus steynii IBT 23096 TaxID=1392250 RepID=A0A2I2GIV3_9EURO|nr:uncharacterized protein P170DRAFT_507540 [Aspergillus steynii IBT 23096]PLB52798.1 hypothetical protein P170DRAFT_507540 [Aspergillus steynii IBT 23096]
MAYASNPAPPILAHSLLTESEPGNKIDSEKSVDADDRTSLSGTWNLQDDIDSGFQCPPKGLFRNGVVIGISTLRSQQRNGNDDEFTGQFPRLLLSAYLHKRPKSPTPFPRAIIIHPATFEGFSPRNLLSSLLAPSQTPQLTREEAIACLDSVQLFPVYDVAAAVQAISEVSNLLDRSEEERSQTHNSERPPETETTTHPSVLLIIAGLDTLAEGAVRASNTVRGAAILTTALRSLTQLSRLHGSFLSVMLVNTGGLGSSGAFSNNANNAQQTNPRRDVGFSYQDDGIHSIFHTSETPLLPSLLMRTLDQGIDTHLLLSRSRTATVVEVIKDRVGEGIGKWCIWDRRGK